MLGMSKLKEDFFVKSIPSIILLTFFFINHVKFKQHLQSLPKQNSKKFDLV